MVKYVNLGWTNNLAKAPYEDGSDSKGCRPGAQNGLDTRVVLAVNTAH